MDSKAIFGLLGTAVIWGCWVRTFWLVNVKNLRKYGYSTNLYPTEFEASKVVYFNLDFVLAFACLHMDHCRLFGWAASDALHHLCLNRHSHLACGWSQTSGLP